MAGLAAAEPVGQRRRRPYRHYRRRRDANDRLSQFKQAGLVKASYRYNAIGERVARADSASGPAAAYSVYDEAGRWLGDYDATGATQQQAVWLGDAPVGLLAGAGTAQKLHYVQPDHLGTPRAVIDATRNVAIWSWEAKGEAFGNSVPNQDPDLDGTAFVFDMRFPGQRYDAASGLVYNYFRDYDPGTGRYVQSDPIGLEGGVSTYTYVGGNPIMAVDSLGLETCVVTTSNGVFRDHSALYMSQGGESGEAVLYDPAGSYARSNESGEGDFVEGDAADLAKFASHHSGSKIEKVCKDTSKVEEQRLVRKIIAMASPGVATCAINVSSALHGSPDFPNVKSGTFWPGNLYRDAGGVEPGMPIPNPYLPDPYK